MRFENRVMESWLEDRVSSYFICSLAAEDVVPVCCGKNFVDVVVKWEGGQKWLMRCFPSYSRTESLPTIKSMVDMCRVAMILNARPFVAYVSEDEVEVVWANDNVASAKYVKAA